MASHAKRPPLRIEPRFSPRLAAFVAVTHAAALATTLAMPLAWPWTLVLALAVTVSLGYQWTAHLSRTAPWAVRRVLWAPDGSWTLTLANGRELEAVLCACSFVSTALVVLNFRRGVWRPCSVVLLADATDADLLRRLRVRLRLGGVEGERDPDRAGPPGL